jgi:hypothetical protein
MAQCGRVEPVINHYITIKFVGEDEEKYGLKDWKRCPAETIEGSHCCQKHHENPIKFKSGTRSVGDKTEDTFTPFHPSRLAAIVVTRKK